MAAEPTQTAARVLVPGFRLLERLHQSGPRVIYRARRERDGMVSVLKTLRAEYPAREDVAELRREHRILASLAVDGVVRARSLVEYGAGNVAIELESLGPSLADLLDERGGEPFPVDWVLAVAARLARILGHLHQRELIHKDVVPRNILRDPDSDDVRLIDFGIASELSRERQGATLSRRLEGSLPYLSPEQTGRMSRDVDYRSDYYSLGVTLFQLLTGKLPFEAGDALEWVHRHISQPAPRAHEVHREVPLPVSDIVARLLAKNAEDRYQSTFGLVADLERCREELARTGVVEQFALGARDVSRSFQIPQRLYGREEPMARLAALFDDVAHGGTGCCIVSGYSGVGKSVLVNELGKTIARQRGYLIQGKFDQLQQHSAYAAVALAFRGLMDQLLSEPDVRLAAWRAALVEALGANARLLVDLVPELERIIGPQPPVPRLPPTEAQNRFQIVFLNFVKVFAGRRHPLVIFLDDLQWSDVPSLHLLERMVTAREMDHLFLIGAYRSNAVDATHPLTVTLDRIRKAREVEEIALEPLEAEAVDRLVADTLHAAEAEVRPLSRLVYRKAQGNPLFTRELLKSLHEEGAIAFDPDRGRWGWDPEAAAGALVGEDVAAFMVSILRRLPERTQAVLQLAACIGNTFDLRTLAIIHERSTAETVADLREALRRHLIVPLHESYRYAEADSEGVNPAYRFQHDRVQQAAYALIDPERKRGVHLSVGRLLRRHSTPEERAERLLDIVGHLNAGRALLEDPGERLELARLNLQAGTRAKGSSAYASALGFLTLGQQLIPGDPWETDHALMFALSVEVQHCAYLTGDHAEAERWSEILLARAATPMARAEILSDRTRQYATLGRPRDSIEAAVSGLALLGVHLVERPGPEDVAREAAAVDANLAGRAIADLVREPAIADPRIRTANRLLMEIFPAAFLSGSGDLFEYLVLTSVNLSLRHGSSPESAFSYAAYGMLLCGALDDPATGYEYGKLAVAMNERFEDIALKSRILYVYTMFVHHWSNHWSSMTPWFLRGIEAGYQSGDLLYLAYSAQDCIIWDPTLDLETASREQRRFLTIVKDCEYRDSYDSGTLFLQMQLNFQGLTESTFSLNDAEFDEEACLAGMRERRFMTGIANYHIYKTEIHALYGDWAGALEHVRVQDGLIGSAMSLPQLVRYLMVSFLTRAALWPGMAPEEQAASMERMEAALGQMTRWARHCPENFRHLQLSMEGELARLAGRMPEALGRYEEAIAAARASRFLRDEAVANELAARYLLSLGLEKGAEGYLRAAHHAYHRWGAQRKTRQLEEEHPRWLSPLGERAEGPGPGAMGGTVQVESAALDLSSVMKASQRISGEILLDQLWRTTLQICLENAGAQRGWFVVEEGGELVVRAQAEAGREGSTTRIVLGELPEDQPLLPVSVVNSVLRTGAPLVLDDATASGRFSSDPYIVRHAPRSVICVPIQRPDRFSGAVYMENNLVPGAFSPERVEVLRLLSAQAAISMENAGLYQEQLRLVRAQERFVPGQFLESLGRHDIADVGLGEYVARQMSVMFADLRRFTPLAERLGPKAVIALLNRFFSRIGEPIAQAGGFVDSYNGDEIMALFGLPADRAVQAGIAMRRSLEALNAELARDGQPALEMGVGVNTGPLVLGTVGSQDRLKCGVVGDTVNTASRIEQLTKRYGAGFLIGEDTYRGLVQPDGFSIRPVDRVAVQGKALALTLYEVLDAEPPERRRAKEGTRPLLEEGLRRYAGRDFAGAREAFGAARARDPEDALLEILERRAAAYAEDPPPPEWEGHESLDHK